jgi:hypothetical protein
MAYIQHSSYAQAHICATENLFKTQMAFFFPIEGQITIMEKVKEDSGKKVKEDSRSEQRK